MGTALDDDELEEDQPEEDQEKRAPQIARPLASASPASAVPVTARGIGSPALGAPDAAAAPAALGSTEDLESRGLADRMTPPPIAKPTALQTRKTADETELGRLQSTGTGISQIHNRFARGALRGLNIAGEIAGAVAPETYLALRAIPGTQEHHRDLLGQAQGRLGQDEAEETQQAAVGKTNADTEEAEARGDQAAAAAAKDRSEVQRADLPKPTEEEWLTVPGVLGPNGQIIQQEKHSGQARYAPGISGVGPTKPPVDNATAEDEKYENITARALQGQPVSPEEKAWAQAYKQRKTIGPVTSAALNQPNKDDARMDRSYTLNQGRLDKTRQPIDQLAQRFSRLQDTLNQGSPQADALIGPELLTVMAGGSGSGLRMNEAEISRVVGGRSAWETLKANIQHWSTNPDDARSITADQDKQIRSLIGLVGQKLTAKQKILEDAESALLDAQSVEDHRRVLADTQNKLNAIDAGSSGGAGGAKTISSAAIEKAAKDHNITVDQARKQAEAQGYQIQ